MNLVLILLTAQIMNYNLVIIIAIVKAGFSAHLDENKISKMIDNVIKEKTNKKIRYSYDKQNEKLETNEKIYPAKKEGDHAISLSYHISNNGNNTIAIRC